VDRIEVDLAVQPAWADDRFKVSARAIRLVRPRLKAELGERGLTFGRLDPVVRDFLARPPDESAVGPLVLIEDGAVQLRTDYGALRLGGSGVVDDGRLVRIDGRMQPASLRGDGFAAQLGGGTVRLKGQGERITGRATLDVGALTRGDLGARGAALTVEVDAPYPEGEGAQLDGSLLLSASLRGEAVEVGARRARDVRAGLSVRGRLGGPLRAPAFTGSAELTGAAAALAGPGLDGRAVSWRVSAPRLDAQRTAEGGRASLAMAGEVRAGRLGLAQGMLERPVLAFNSRNTTATLAKSGARVRGPVAARLTAARFDGSGVVAAEVSAAVETSLDLLGGSAPLVVAGRAERLTASVEGRPASLSDVAVRFSGPARTAGGFAWTATGSASAAGGFEPASAARLAARVPVLSGADSHGDALRAALASFSLRAPGLALALGPGRTSVSATEPVRMASRSGAQLAFTGRPLFALADGRASGEAFLTATGGGLPALTLALEDWAAGARGFESPVRFAATGLDAAIARDARVDARGRARLAGGRFFFEAAGCIPVKAAEIEFGETIWRRRRQRCALRRARR
jgi:hypothetical protein